MCCHLSYTKDVSLVYVSLDVDEDDRHKWQEHGGSIGLGDEANVELNEITKLNAKYTEPNKWSGGWKR